MGGPGSGRKKEPKRLYRDARDAIDVNEIFNNLNEWAKGKEVICPHCQERTGCYTADTVALQSNIELLNRKLGKVPQQVQLDVTETIQLNADQIDILIEKHLPAIASLVAQRYNIDIPLLIEGEYKELPPE